MSTDEQASATSSAITGIHAVAVNVADQDRALEFYLKTLDLELRFDSDLGGASRCIEVAPQHAPPSIALVAANTDSPAGGDSGIRLLTPDAEALHRAMVTAGVDVGEILRWTGVPLMLTLRDPDANTLYIMETETTGTQ